MPNTDSILICFTRTHSRYKNQQDVRRTGFKQKGEELTGITPVIIQDTKNQQDIKLTGSRHKVEDIMG